MQNRPKLEVVALQLSCTSESRTGVPGAGVPGAEDIGQVSMRLHTDDLGVSLASRTRGARVPLGRRGRAGEYAPACGSEKEVQLDLAARVGAAGEAT